jgi:hypothetical protein
MDKIGQNLIKIQNLKSGLKNQKSIYFVKNRMISGCLNDFSKNRTFFQKCLHDAINHHLLCVLNNERCHLLCTLNNERFNRYLLCNMGAEPPN